MSIGYLQRVQLKSRLGWAYLATILAGILTALSLMILHPLISRLCTSFGQDYCAVRSGLIVTVGTFVIALAFTALWCGLGPWYWVAMTAITVAWLPFLLDPGQSWATPVLLIAGPVLSVGLSLPQLTGRRPWWQIAGLLALLVLGAASPVIWFLF